MHKVIKIVLLCLLLLICTLNLKINLKVRASTSSVLYVNASNQIGTFDKKMLGMAMVNWEHSWGKPYLNEVPGLVNALKAANVGLIRYAGGNWANYVGFDTTKSSPNPYTNWTHNGFTYSFNYGTDEITSVQRAASTIGADVIVQVNISNNDPSMWASMVRFTNFGNDPITGRPKLPIKYWEFGNELDMACNGGDATICVNPTEYANRVVTYQQQMLAVDPTIKFLGAGQSTAVQNTGTNSSLSQYFFTPLSATKNSGHVIDGVTYHWYMQCGSDTLADILRYRWYNSDGTPLNPPTLWNNQYSRFWGDAAPSAIKSQVIANYPGVFLGITELNFNACNYDSVFNGNHINALWISDELGRMAYNGLNFLTFYEGYGTQGMSVFYPDNDNAPTKIFIRPSYYAFLLYAKYFGDKLVQSSSTDNQNLSIWAAKSSIDSSKLYLRITNLSANPITAPINIDGFTATSGQVYTLSSTNPTDTTTLSNTQDSGTNINGIKLDAMNMDNDIGRIQPVSLNISGNSFTFNFPAYSSVAIILSSNTTSKPGDINGDGLVNILDYTLLSNAFGSNNPAADLNHDQIINILDYTILSNNFGS